MENILVITCAQFKQIERAVLAEPGFVLVKRKGPDLYFWCGSQKGREACIQELKRQIAKSPFGNILGYSIVPLLNGKKDLFGDYPLEQRLKMDYYKSKRMDITQEEIDSALALQ